MPKWREISLHWPELDVSIHWTQTDSLVSESLTRATLDKSPQNPRWEGLSSKSPFTTLTPRCNPCRMFSDLGSTTEPSPACRAGSAWSRGRLLVEEQIRLQIRRKRLMKQGFSPSDLTSKERLRQCNGTRRARTPNPRSQMLAKILPGPESSSSSVRGDKYRRRRP